MIKTQFNLQPFSVDKSKLNCEVKANLISNGNDFSIHYQVFGDFEKIIIPAVVKKPSREDNLWENTCFEFFLGIINTPVYWEFNLSPSGNWNVYNFTNYREGMKAETAFSSLPFQFSQESDHLSVKITIDLAKIIQTPQEIELAITMVIQEDGNISYWALKHPGSEADFHRRDSFVALRKLAQNIN